MFVIKKYGALLLSVFLLASCNKQIEAIHPEPDQPERYHGFHVGN
jgi:uncharacterized lipoprotein YajG